MERKLATCGKFSWCIYGHEICPSTSKPHLQGAVWLNKPSTKGNLYKYMQRNFSGWSGEPGPEKGLDYWLQYCTKDQCDIVQWGIPPTKEEVDEDLKSNQGKRTDLDKFKDAVESGVIRKRDLMRDHSTVWARHRNFCEEYLHTYAPRQPCPDIQLYGWQEKLLQELKGPVNDRSIIYIVDHVGKAGKSTFCKYLRHHLEDVEVVSVVSFNDLAYMYDISTKVLLVDVPRNSMEYIPYSFLEKVKDGEFTSGKYNSHNKHFIPPHVVVFCNEEPDTTKLSRDRYDVRVIA